MAPAGAQPSSLERIALTLFPHRASILAAGLGAFLLAAFPLAAVARGDATLAPWHVAGFAASVPLVLWAIGLTCVACFYHPVHGLVTSPDAPAGRWLRGYAALTCWAFAVAPLVVLLSAAR